MNNNTYWKSQNDSCCNRLISNVDELKRITFSINDKDIYDVAKYNELVQKAKIWANNLHILDITGEL